MNMHPGLLPTVQGKLQSRWGLLQWPQATILPDLRLYIATHKRTHLLPWCCYITGKQISQTLAVHQAVSFLWIFSLNCTTLVVGSRKISKIHQDKRALKEERNGWESPECWNHQLAAPGYQRPSCMDGPSSSSPLSHPFHSPSEIGWLFKDSLVNALYLPEMSVEYFSHFFLEKNFFINWWGGLSLRISISTQPRKWL